MNLDKSLLGIQVTRSQFKRIGSCHRIPASVLSAILGLKRMIDAMNNEEDSDEKIE